MIERFPEGTDEIPYPHNVHRWADGGVSMDVWLDPRHHVRTALPKIEGWEPHFIGFHGYDKDMRVSYRPSPPPTRPAHRREVRRLSPVVFEIGRCVEDRSNLTDEQLDLMWETLANSIDATWDMIGPVIDAIEDDAMRTVTV